MELLPHVTVFRRLLWMEPGLLFVVGDFRNVIEGRRAYSARHGIPAGPEEALLPLGRLLAAAALAAVSLAERESWGWTMTFDGSPHGFFCAVEPEGMLTAVVRAADPGKGLVALQRQRADEPCRQSAFEPVGDDPARAVERYFHQVEQTQTRIAVMEEEEGVLVQKLPGGDFQHVAHLRDRELAVFVHELRERGALRDMGEVLLFYECRCSERMIGDLIANLDPSSREALWGDQARLEVTCPRCGRGFVLSKRAG